MKVIVTGSAGFVGQAVVKRLRREHDVVATDRDTIGDPRLVVGDLCNPEFIAALLHQGCDAVVHLATVPGGAAEADPGLGWAVNVGATRSLADAAIGIGARFIFASSIAVLGDLGDAPVDDHTPPAPRLLYGGHKAVAEAWLATLARRRDLPALALRLPGIVARPAGSTALRSAFMSDVFHAVTNNRAIDLPVSAGATLWLMSAARVAENFAHALTLPDGEYDGRAVTLPAIRTRMDALVAAIALHTGNAAKVSYTPDAGLEKAFGRLPPLSTAMADTLGFGHDGDLGRLVTHVLDHAG